MPTTITPATATTDDPSEDPSADLTYDPSAIPTIYLPITLKSRKLSSSRKRQYKFDRTYMYYNWEVNTMSDNDNDQGGREGRGHVHWDKDKGR